MRNLKSPVNILVQQIEVAYERIFALYHDVDTPSISTVTKSELLPTALKELGVASEELQVAAEELYRQSEELVSTRATIQAECHRYQSLFEFAPDAYFVTDFQGVIQQANQAASRSLDIPQQFLAGRALAGFVPEAERQAFRSKLSYLRQSKRVQEIETLIQPRSQEAFDVSLRVLTVRDSLGEPRFLCWLMRKLAWRKQLSSQQEGSYDFIQNHSVHSYTKGEIVLLKPQTICLVLQGVVKLNTFSENGKEVLMGMAGPSTVFGSMLTSMPVYQAIAMSEVQLVYISQEQINTSSQLANLILPKITQRLKQTEKLLLIAGQPRVKDRLWQLLLLLKQELGEPIDSGGVRLGIRLTHEDLASACCTTRVTVTRLITHFLQTGQISVDKQYIILHE